MKSSIRAPRKHRLPAVASLPAIAALGILCLALPAAAADLATADRLFQEQEWAQAAEAYAAALGDEVDDGNAWFQYGYALYRLERDQEALRAFEKADAGGATGPRLFAAAGTCAARLGDDDRALALLDRAVQAGLPVGPLKATPAFDRLRERPEFQAVVATAEAASYPCRQHAESHQFDFWIGRWNVFSRGQQAGTNDIQGRFEGCLLQENYTTAGGYAGSSFNFYDPSLPGWRQIWVDNGGQVMLFEGNLEDGKMVFHGRNIGKDGSVQLTRMTFTPNDDGSVRQLIETRADEGEAWSTSFDGSYVRAE